MNALKCALTAFALCFAFAAPAVAQQTVVLPANSHASQYGNGWECNYGYVDVADTCSAVTRPANSRLNARGDHWECLRGFRSSEARACRAIVVPERGYLADFPRRVSRSGSPIRQLPLRCPRSGIRRPMTVRVPAFSQCRW